MNIIESLQESYFKLWVELSSSPALVIEKLHIILLSNFDWVDGHMKQLIIDKLLKN